MQDGTVTLRELNAFKLVCEHTKNPITAKDTQALIIALLDSKKTQFTFDLTNKEEHTFYTLVKDAEIILRRIIKRK